MRSVAHTNTLNVLSSTKVELEETFSRRTMSNRWKN